MKQLTLKDLARADVVPQAPVQDPWKARSLAEFKARYMAKRGKEPNQHLCDVWTFEYKEGKE
jgi:hypothetical protein